MPILPLKAKTIFISLFAARSKFFELIVDFFFVKCRKEPPVLGIKDPEVAGNYVLLDPVTLGFPDILPPDASTHGLVGELRVEAAERYYLYEIRSFASECVSKDRTV